jgi:predicted RNA-binding protein with PIN domain
MSYLIDGNNVMGQRVGWHRDKAGARRRLLEELARFARTARVKVAVVFDGAPDEHFPEGSSFMGVSVYYAERGADADARVKQMVEASRERRTLKVVTSDRALADYVRRCGVEVIRSGEFRRRLDEAGGAGGNTPRREDAAEAGREGVGAAEIEEWMAYFGVAPEDDERAMARRQDATAARKDAGERAGKNRQKRRH